MEGIEGDSSGRGEGSSRYTLKPSRICSEDILFCVDVDPQCLVEMKGATGPNGRPLTRLDSIKQAIILFANAKLTINPEHRFAFATISNSVYWMRKEFSSEIESTIAAMRGLSASSSTGQPDLTNLFRLAAHEAKKSRLHDRILRVILFYCRSSERPQHQWPVNQKLFTLDVMYLHDKPGPDNCPQEVYDTLVEALEHVSEYEGYILESGQGLARVLFRHVLILLSHPQQRCIQEYVDIPKSIAKKVPQVEPMATEDSAPIASQ
ncbi:BRISC and BRCA1-A complex member 1 [Spatholobus suberectus]|nr:BRISC and BRCA1-A complex member 1 [Spatholobus suberectus]